MDFFHRANTLYIDEDYEAAFEQYSASIKDASSNPLAYSYRAACNLKLRRNHTLALQDCNNALSLDPNHEPTYFRKGKVSFELEEYETAKSAFERGLDLRRSAGKDVANYLREIRKCESEIKEDVSVLDPEVVLNPNQKSADSSSSSSSVSDSVSDISSRVPSSTQALKESAVLNSIKYQYYQSNECMNITILAKQVDPKDAMIDIQETSLKAVIRLDGREETVIDKHLFGRVMVDGCKVDVRPTKIEIKLKKAVPMNWLSLEGSERSNAWNVDGSMYSAPSPSSMSKKAKAYASSRDWNQIDQEISKELEAEKPEGEEALQKLFKDIYAKADEDTRRAMNKSFATSGGTVLSTNWKEVGTKNYEEERQAPKGVEWRNWEGEKLKQTDD